MENNPDRFSVIARSRKQVARPHASRARCDPPISARRSPSSRHLAPINAHVQIHSERQRGAAGGEVGGGAQIDNYCISPFPAISPAAGRLPMIGNFRTDDVIATDRLRIVSLRSPRKILYRIEAFGTRARVGGRRRSAVANDTRHECVHGVRYRRFNAPLWHAANDVSQKTHRLIRSKTEARVLRFAIDAATVGHHRSMITPNFSNL
ncbi:hypothetical protein EVAR_52822_1 [Eumeta japonica]|uniref:Uncharacterized protein n=1 Tax=Eumeta variegata TaxID=151549 RepID=A0A4C1YB51_EUMVA|nr:hypothetical protein EVAR_52822_1 [Eumeta japonica]